MTSKTTSNGDRTGTFSRDDVVQIYYHAVGQLDHYFTSIQSAEQVLQIYPNDEEREELNSRIWRGELPAKHAKTGKIYSTHRQALGEIVHDAEFYAQGNLEVVVEVARQSIYTDF